MMEPLDAAEIDMDAAPTQEASSAAVLAAPAAEAVAATPVQQSAAATSATAAATSAWPRAYSSALSKSMKAMRLLRSAGANSADDDARSSNAGSYPAAKSDAEQDEKAFKCLLLAIESNESQEMLDQTGRSPQALRMTTKDERLPLHLVCALVPNFLFVDVIRAMIASYSESAGSMDKIGQTPLHVLSLNPSVTVQALELLVAALPACVAMRDKRSNLPLHYLCGTSSSNGGCDPEMLRLLGADELCATKNEDQRTPLHCLAMRTTANKDALLFLLDHCPKAARSLDADGRSVLHWVCELHTIDLDVLEHVLAVSADSVNEHDSNDELPVHILCRNVAAQPELLRRLVSSSEPSAALAPAVNGTTPLHLLCANEGVTPELLAELLAFDDGGTALSALDTLGASPLHVLCMNESMTSMHLRALLLVCDGDDAFAQDVYGRSPLHYLCMSRAISSECLWLFFERSSDLVRQLDKDGRTPLHYVCCNSSVTSIALEILFDAWPGAAMVADKELKLPVQYLVDNPVSIPEISALLISGPSSYRLRYDFLGAATKCASYAVDAEPVHAQTSFAVDSKSATKVMMRFFSTALAASHECDVLLRLKHALTESEARGDEAKDLSLRIIDEFDDAKRRVALRSSAMAPEDQTGLGASDTPVVLNHALVTEAPVYTLEGLVIEQLEDMAGVKAIVSDVAECLLFWHRSARVVHGNISLRNFGHFASPGLKLFNCSASRALDQRRSVSRHAMEAAACPPEAARAFLSNDAFEPTPASDIWQFGCLVFLLATGKTLLEHLAPWSTRIGDEQTLHLVSALTESTLASAIGAVHSELQPILHRTLVLNPSERWSIDRLSRAPGIAIPADGGDSTESPDAYESLHSKLQHHSDALVDGSEHERSAKHAQDQLDFMRREQTSLRRDLVASKSQLRDADARCARLETEMEQLRQQLASVVHQREEAKLEVQVFAHNHQSMTHQLHTTVQMLLNLVPLARKVYGAKADEFLSGALSQAAGCETELDAPTPSPLATRRKSALQAVKSRLQSSRFAYGCVSTWASTGTGSSNLASADAADDWGFESHAENTASVSEKMCTSDVEYAVSAVTRAQDKAEKADSQPQPAVDIRDEHLAQVDFAPVA